MVKKGKYGQKGSNNADKQRKHTNEPGRGQQPFQKRSKNSERLVHFLGVGQANHSREKQTEQETVPKTIHQE